MNGDNADQVKIVPIKERPDAIPIAARWRLDQWGHQITGSSLDMFTVLLRDSLHSSSLPQTWIVLRGNHIAGVASLAESDMHTRPDLSPWLVGVYIDRDDRGQGIGSALVSHVVAQAWTMGIVRLWLFTPDQEHFYQRLGWQAVERTVYRGEDVVIMKIEPKS